MLVLTTALAIPPAAPPDLGGDLPLFTEIALIEVKASSEEPTCEGAREALLAKAHELGAKRGLTEILRLVPGDLASPALTEIPCKLTGIPDAPSGATTSATVVMSRPGEGFPTAGREQQATLAGLLTSVHQIDPDSLGLVESDGEIWVDAGLRVHESMLESSTQNARAVKMLNTHVIPWVTRWAPLASTTPQVAGAILTVEVRAEAPRGKVKEHIVYRVASGPAAEFTVGRLAEPDWANSLIVSVIANTKKPVPEPMTLDLDGTGGAAAVSGRKGIGALDDIEDE